MKPEGYDPFKDFEVITIDPGDEINCDLCNKSFKGLPDIGGYIFGSKAVGSKAVCPNYADDFLIRIKKYNEERYIKAICKPGMSFYNFILRYRKENY
ncbi:MAG: hypothetical protein KAS32_01170 [Candidatus Peribacteraceae bacterium]|nr:hypothetical protein [Candidatus Peribacteraceae bacterium]